jgi:hypothetical protein
LFWRQLVDVYLNGSLSLPLPLDWTLLAIVSGALFPACGALLGFADVALFLDIVVFRISAGGLCWFLW